MGDPDRHRHRFALAALGVVGHRAPAELRTFLLTLAVVDDLATIAVIAVFYSQGISLAWLGGGALMLVALVAMQRVGVRALMPYVVLAAALWYAVHESGVHATIAGVALGFLTPARYFTRDGRPARPLRTNSASSSPSPTRK